MEITTVQISKTEKPNSFEFGKAGNRFKLYFEDAMDLKKQMNDLKLLGMYKEDDINDKNNINTN